MQQYRAPYYHSRLSSWVHPARPRQIAILLLPVQPLQATSDKRQFATLRARTRVVEHGNCISRTAQQTDSLHDSHHSTSGRYSISLE